MDEYFRIDRMYFIFCQDLVNLSYESSKQFLRLHNQKLKKFGNV